VLFFKNNLGKITSHYYRIIIGSTLSFSLFFFPELYGEGYHAIKVYLQIQMKLKYHLDYLYIYWNHYFKTNSYICYSILGGDGGVFAPSLFIGAFFGSTSSINIQYVYANVIPLNFMVIGMAAMLSSIHPFHCLILIYLV
jgi:CIC family chloride channel protein